MNGENVFFFPNPERAEKDEQPGNGLGGFVASLRSGIEECRQADDLEVIQYTDDRLKDGITWDQNDASCSSTTRSLAERIEGMWKESHLTKKKGEE